MKSRKLLMIPGPIEFEPAVLRAMSAPTTSHVAPNFIESFGNALDLMKEAWLCPSGQPFAVAGSGTLAMDMAAANLTEAGDKCLVVSTGYFGERYADILRRYGAEVTILRAPVGEAVSLVEIEEALKGDSFKLLTFTHVDTSTSVRMDAKSIGALGQKYGVLTILDGVCSVIGEEIRQEEWGLDIVLTASQKAVGVPPGLALLVASPQAMETWKTRTSPVPNYYADWANWLPIMEAYQARKPSYFGTPAVNLVAALEASLQLILKEGMDATFARHARIAAAFRAAMKALGISPLAKESDHAANTLTASWYPDSIDGNAFRAAVSGQGVIIAGGLLADLKTRYFRVGHMGPITPGDILATIGAIEAGLGATGYRFESGAGLAATMEILGR